MKKLLRNFFADDSGVAGAMTGAYALLFILLLMMVVFQTASYKAVSDRLEDALAASGLAASLVDIEQYGIDHSLIISNVRDSYEKYIETLDTNLGIVSGRPASGFIDGPVRVEDFRIYNVRSGRVTEILVNESGSRILREGSLGDVRAPNGQVVDATGIYSEVSFPLKRKMGISPVARKSKLTSVNAL